MFKVLEYIKNRSAMELLNKYDISMKPPIDLHELLLNIGISALATDFSDIEKKADCNIGDILSATISNDDKSAIFYRKQDSENTQRFSIAHELAHCCLHGTDLEGNHVELRINREVKSDNEFKTNLFAGELLMPIDSLNDVYSKLIIPSLSSLTQIFEVPSNVISARLDYLKMVYLKDIY